MKGCGFTYADKMYTLNAYKLYYNYLFIFPTSLLNSTGLNTVTQKCFTFQMHWTFLCLFYSNAFVKLQKQKGYYRVSCTHAVQED